VFGEEAGGGPDGGAMYELTDPLHTTNVTLDRATGTFSGGTGADNLDARPALGRMAFEGLAILDSGVTYMDADDDGQGPVDGKPGNAFFKFVPDHPYTGGGSISMTPPTHPGATSGSASAGPELPDTAKAGSSAWASGSRCPRSTTSISRPRWSTPA
jgi:hypothetical protein